jgi:hypothetical protein
LLTLFLNVIYVAGGGNDGREVYRCDFAFGLWSNLAPTAGRHGYGASFVLGECLYVVGGGFMDMSMEPCNMVSDTWTVVADMLEGRSHHRAVAVESIDTEEEQDLFNSLIASMRLTSAGKNQKYQLSHATSASVPSRQWRASNFDS